jgi:hypothetical protein
MRANGFFDLVPRVSLVCRKTFASARADGLTSSVINFLVFFIRLSPVYSDFSSDKGKIKAPGGAKYVYIRIPPSGFPAILRAAGPQRDKNAFLLRKRNKK